MELLSRSGKADGKVMFPYATLRSLPEKIRTSGPSGNMLSGLQTDVLKHAKKEITTAYYRQEF